MMRDSEYSQRRGGRSRSRSNSPIRYRSRSNTPQRKDRRNRSKRSNDHHKPSHRSNNYRGRDQNRGRRSPSRSRSPQQPERKPVVNSINNTAKQQIRQELTKIEGKADMFEKSKGNNDVSTSSLPPPPPQKQEKSINFEEGTKFEEPKEEEDMEIILDFEDLDELEERKRKEEEEERRKAEERRRRLEEIKSKYQQSSTQEDLSTAQGEKIEGRGRSASISVAAKEEVMGEEEEIVEDSILNKNAIFPQTFDDENQTDQTIMEITAEDEGNQLAREKLALQEEKEALGKVTFDMFSDSPSDLEKNNGKLPIFPPTGGGPGMGGRRVTREALLDGENPHLQSNWDDHDGYYKATIGELIGDRFQILGIVGKGVFSTVLKCVDTRVGDGSNIVAIKMIRNNDIMRKAADKEKNILLAIAEKDPNNKRFCVKLITYLEYRQHVALAFEYKSMNLREALKKFGKDVGINITAVRIYARQLFVALRYLMELKVIHADIKLDNILLSEDLKQIRLCDFGSAFYETDIDNDPTPYLVNRFSRAPEIILGLQYDRQVDFWSMCVSLFELFTGHVMFPGRSNNEMLKLFMTMKGRFPNKMIKSHFRSYEMLQLEPHFDQDYRFRSHETDAVSGEFILYFYSFENDSLFREASVEDIGYHTSHERSCSDHAK